MVNGKDFGFLILRLSTGLMLVLHGINKIANGISYIKSTVAEHGLPVLLSYGVFLGEVIGPIILLIGYKTRIGGVMIVINMLFAIYLVHAGEIGQLGTSGGWAVEKPALFLFAALTLIFTGGGKYAVSHGKWGD